MLTGTDRYPATTVAGLAVNTTPDEVRQIAKQAVERHGVKGVSVAPKA